MIRENRGKLMLPRRNINISKFWLNSISMFSGAMASSAELSNERNSCNCGLLPRMAMAQRVDQISSQFSSTSSGDSIRSLKWPRKYSCVTPERIRDTGCASRGWFFLRFLLTFSTQLNALRWSTWINSPSQITIMIPSGYPRLLFLFCQSPRAFSSSVKRSCFSLGSPLISAISSCHPAPLSGCSSSLSSSGFSHSI